MRILLSWLFCAFAGSAYAQRTVAISVPGQSSGITADLYGNGAHGVVLAHGGPFARQSWSEQAKALSSEGFMVLAISFRGDGSNADGSPGSFGSDSDNAADVLAAVAYLHGIGARTVDAIGASLGGDAVGEADAASAHGDIERIVLLASSGGSHPERLKGRKLFIVARDDANASGRRLNQISEHFARATRPKQLFIVAGSAHAQYLFATVQGPQVYARIRSFLRQGR